MAIWKIHLVKFIHQNPHRCTSVSKNYYASQSEAPFFLGECPVKRALFGRLADIFANNTVISPWRAKHASVCLLIPHKRKVYSFVLLHKQRQTFPFIVQASSPFFLAPSSLSPGRTQSARNKLGGLQTTHRASKDLSMTLFLFLLPLLPSYRLTRSHCFKWSPVQFCSIFIIALSHCSHISSSLRPAWPRQSRGCMPTVAYLNCHSSNGFCPSVCLKRLMWTVERMVT